MFTFNSTNVALPSDAFKSTASNIATINKMQYSSISRLTKAIFISLFALGLSACGEDKYSITPTEPPTPPAPTEYSYTVMVTNLTYAQPLSPIAVLLHDETKLWSTGESSSVALEKLAEGGDNTDFLALDNVLESMSGEGVVLPGTSASISINTTNSMAKFFSVATMLVNTNDAFSGLTGIDISSMAVNDNKSWNLNVYDAGTEANNEAAGTIPGPADGGDGFSEARDDVDFISYHSGVVSQNDGLTSSVLTQAHRFDNPAIKLTITRTK
jgi:hypothetical protein